MRSRLAQREVEGSLHVVYEGAFDGTELRPLYVSRLRRPAWWRLRGGGRDTAHLFDLVQVRRDADLLEVHRQIAEEGQ